jgi:signal peptidase I
MAGSSPPPNGKAFIQRMDVMNIKITRLLAKLSGVALVAALTAGFACAQEVATNAKATQTPDAKDGKTTTKTTDKTKANKTATTADKEPTSQTVGDDAGDYKVVGSIEFGYRGQRVDGDVNKFKSDLNYKAGPRIFDSSFFMKAKDGKSPGLFDSLMVTSTGWGADPQGNLRISIENPEWYRFEGQYRRFKYYRFLNNIANPTWLFSPIQTVANPVTGLHGFDTRTTMGDFDMTILPKNEMIRFNIGYSPERYEGPSYTNYHNGGNDFWMLNNLKSKADDWRVGADGKFSIVDWTFVQGFRRFRDDSFIPAATGLNVNTATSVAVLTSFLRQEPTRGSVDYTRFSIHSLINGKLDITGRGIYSRSSMNATYLEQFAGRNFNFRITGFPPTPPNAQPNTTNPSNYTIASDTRRPSHVIDFGLTYLASDKFRISNTLHQEAFTIDGLGLFSAFFSLTRPITGGSRTDTFTVSPVPQQTLTKYSKITDTIEGDYQINRNYALHFGYRFGHRHDIVQTLGFAISGNNPSRITDPTAEIEENNTNAFFGGFKARFTKNWNVYFDAEHGTADNVFTRIGNYNYTNVRAKSRYSPNRKLNFNVGLIIRDNGNPSEIAGVNAQDFGVDLKTRIFTSSVDWLATDRVTVNFGYNYNWVDSDAVIDYYYNSIFHHLGHALYHQRNNYFFADVTSRLNRRMTLYTSFRMNKDNGQGNTLSDPAGGTPITGGFVPPGGSSPVTANLGGTMITSYPMNFVTPEARLSIMLNRHLDWNLGYQYYAYNENGFLKTFPGSPRAQNYHAHLPYMSLRIYVGRKE